MTRADLWSALDLDAASPPVVAIVGGGGKTSLLYRLGRDAADRGVTAVLGGTTRFTPAPARAMPPLLVAPEAALGASVRAALHTDPQLVATTGHEPQGRFAPLPPAAVEAIAGLEGLGLLALEADGSKTRPFKAPADHEPVIPPSTTHVVAVVGVDAVDAPLDEAHVHRPERVRALLADPAVERCTIEVITCVLVHPHGGRKHVEDRRFVVLVNKADRDPAAAEALATALLAAGAPRVVVASLRDEAAPVRSVLVAGTARV